MGHLYEGVLQYLVENPFLCEEINPNTTSFNSGGLARKAGFTLKESADQSPENENQDVVEIRQQPVVLLAARGECPFHYKAMVAESLGPLVEFLIIYNHNLDGEDVLVPMYSEYGSSRLKLLSVTHRTGAALKRYIADASKEQKAQGGPFIAMDSLPPEGVMTAQDLQDVLISTLGLFFMLLSCSGCFLVCAAAVQHRRRLAGHENGRRYSPLWMILMGDPDTDPVMVGDPVTSSHTFVHGRTLLNASEITEYLINNRNNSSGANARTSDSISTSSDSHGETGERTDIATIPTRHDVSKPEGQALPSSTHCAICIDDFEENSSEAILTLPCNHAFHTDCIVPWLTERQSKCPLCKYDVFRYVQELASEEQPTSASSRTWRRPHIMVNLFQASSWLSFVSSPSPTWMALDGQERLATLAAELEMTAAADSTSSPSSSSAARSEESSSIRS